MADAVGEGGGERVAGVEGVAEELAPLQVSLAEGLPVHVVLCAPRERDAVREALTHVSEGNIKEKGVVTGKKVTAGAAVGEHVEGEKMEPPGVCGAVATTHMEMGKAPNVS